MGMPWNEAVDLLLETLDLPITREEYITEANKLQHLFLTANLLPGVDKLITHLARHNIPIAVHTLLRFSILKSMSFLGGY